MKQILKGLNDLNSHFAILLENTYDTSLIEEKGFKALNTIDCDRFNSLFEVNLKLNTPDQFSFYLVHSKLTIVNKPHDKVCERAYDEQGNLVWPVYREKHGSVSLGEWYDPNKTINGLQTCVPLSLFKRILDFQSRSVNNDLEIERVWFNCSKTTDKNQSKN